MKSVVEFAEHKAKGRPISIVTCYDAWSGKLIANTDIDAVLVGDSVSMVVHGFDSTVHATIEMMALHTAAARRGLGDLFIIADLPFPSHRRGPAAAMEAVDALMKAGANAVKLEGVKGHEEVIECIVGSGVPVMGHLGLTPQSVHALGGYRVQGRDEASALRMRHDAERLQELGCFSLVLECVPLNLAQIITNGLNIPTIGIGSGPHCSGQVLVFHDLLGLNEGFRPRFLRQFSEGSVLVVEGLQSYHEAVIEGDYPSEAESFLK